MRERLVTQQHVGGRFHNPVVRWHDSDARSLGERAADTIAIKCGSWGFIFCFLAFLGLWMLYNGGTNSGHFDPYPYILLNLCLSCLAAIQAPIILMSQNRADAKRNDLAEQDFLVNRRAEAENRVIAQSLGIPVEEFVCRVDREMQKELMIDTIPGKIRQHDHAGPAEITAAPEQGPTR